MAFAHNKPCHCETSSQTGRGNPHPPSLAPLPKGGWHGEAVTGGFFSCVPCNAFVGATLAVARPLHLLLRFRRGRRPRRPDPNFSRTYGRAHGPCPTRRCVIEAGRTESSAPTSISVGATLAVARGRGRAPPLRTSCNPSVGAGVLDGPTGFFRTRQGTRALPYKALRYRGRTDRVVRPYKPFRRAGCPHPAAGIVPHSLQKPCHCCGNPYPRPRKYFSLHAKKGLRHPAEPLFKPIQFIRNPHCPPCAGAAPHPGCCSLP